MEVATSVTGVVAVGLVAGLYPAMRAAMPHILCLQEPDIRRRNNLTDAEWVGFRVVRPLRKPSAEEALKYDIDEEQKTDMLDYQQMRGAVE